MSEHRRHFEVEAVILAIDSNYEFMKCGLCKHGITAPGLVTVTLERGESLVIIKRVPAEVCDNCGEYYLSDDITEHVLQRAEIAINNGAEVEIIRYPAQEIGIGAIQ